MPGTTSTNLLAGKISVGLEDHQNEETVFDTGGDLPEGLMGIAQLKDCKIGTYEKGANKGEMFFRMSGIVVSHNNTSDGTSYVGRRTQIGPEPVCDTPEKEGKTARRTLRQHNRWITNELKKFDEAAVKSLSPDGSDFADLMSALEEAAPYFSFRTWKGSKQTEGKYAGREPQIQHSWNGIVEFTPSENSQAAGVVDNTGQEDETPVEEEDAPVEEEEQLEATKDVAEIAALLVLCKKDKGEAQATLVEMAIANSDMDRESVLAIPTWEEVAGLAGGTEVEPIEEEEPLEEEEEEEEEEVSFTKGDRVIYKKREYECHSANQQKKTCKLRNPDSERLLKDMVSWDNLVHVE